MCNSTWDLITLYSEVFGIALALFAYGMLQGLDSSSGLRRASVGNLAMAILSIYVWRFGALPSLAQAFQVPGASSQGVHGL